jgi:prophage tail gpP-like protein
MPDIALTVNSRAYAGWKTARVTRGIESISGGFELSVSDRWEAGSAPWPIYEGDECTLSLAGITVITGYVDKRSVSYGAGEHALSVSGRDKAGALVDNSYLGPPWEWLNTPVLTVAQRVAEQQDVAVSLAAGLSPGASPAKISVDPGDSCHNVIEKLCRKAGVLAVSDGAGRVVLMRPGSTRTVTELVEGENILSASADFDGSARFRRYVVLGQHQGTDQFSGTNAAAVRGEATDAGVTRASRVLLVRPEGNVTTDSARRRAEWEATVRAARGDAVSITVQGWTQGNGVLWPVNALVRVRSPSLGVDGDMLISQVVYSVGEDGTKTALTLRRPDAFTPEPGVASPAKGSAKYWKEIERGVK